MRKTATKLADGRELIYYDAGGGVLRDAPDPRPLPPVTTTVTEVRHDHILGDDVVIASHRQTRTFLPPTEACPLCPSSPGRPTEIPAADYEVAVFENRFPSLAGTAGRCEVVCFTPDHHTSFAGLTDARAALVLAVWTDRTAELAALPAVRQVFCFENRGEEIGVTLGHPHGQIYAYPFVTPRTERMLVSAAAHAARTGGGNLFDDVVAAEHEEGRRIVLATDHWTAFVPYAAHWPYEVHLYPRRRVPDLLALGDAARTEFPQVYLELLRRFDRIFDGREGGDGHGTDGPPTPYVSAWHQAPFQDPRRSEFALHLELFTVRRAPGKLKFLAGSESGMNVFINDVPPETAAERLREVASQ
ncbi:galactose-1-phosphate uridylyltransferase [Streptomyces rectiverticillatus]|uniref:galactose-1-phosphate uridylyltransferase n=1 Tax=Streptomyces rectiverticillatus TaxID=173860 RepID=UPI0015C35A33|nr:galactose-1-phosphate uridylyltransferase [Streptomyces rectiverticillatus]QLE72418.1 galactose-1-phosphate uridylyltransferase [Streptomyces rectiverticillatus]